VRYDISIHLPDVRLNKRYLGMVKGHLQRATTTATGIAVPANVATSFAVTQATWRFLDNDRVTPQALVAPLRHFARQQLANSRYALAVIDWSKIDYKKHTAKRDIVQLTHEHDIGYELTTHLLVSAENGRAIAPIQMHLKTADGYLSTAETALSSDTHHLEQVLPLMRDAATLAFPPTLVHVIDREADSLFHWRQWLTSGFLLLVRGDDRWARWRGELVKYSTIEARLEAEGAFRPSREVTIKGKPGVQYVAEAEVVLDRPVRRRVKGRCLSFHGATLSLRLVIAKVIDPKSGEVLSTWYLMTNVPSDVSSEQIALWYYWRWEIESFFKLLKSGGQQLEHWQQESGEAVLKRLLVASMACALVWSLQQSDDEQSEAFKSVLVRLSGKRLKRGRSPTPGILLSGLFVLLQMVDFLTESGFDHPNITPFQAALDKYLPGMTKKIRRSQKNE